MENHHAIHGKINCFDWAILCWFYREEYNITITGWWFQTLILFPFHINGMSDCHPNPIDEVIIFQRGWLKPPSSTCHEKNPRVNSLQVSSSDVDNDFDTSHDL